MILDLEDKMRLVFRRIVRVFIKISPRYLKRLFSRVPFSRFHKIPPLLFTGEEKIHWRGVEIKVNPGAPPGYYIYFLNIYEEGEVGKLIELCKEQCIFADIGANIGLFSLAIAHACPQIKVFSFEPDRSIAGEFEKNLNLNKHLTNRIDIIKSAVADIEGNLFFQRSKSFWDNGYPGSEGRISGSKTSYLVSSLRLDSFFLKKGRCPDVVKIDVEGAEYRVLKGMKGLFDKGYPKVIMVEMHSFHYADALGHNRKIKELLDENGYGLHRLKGKKWQNSDHPETWPSWCRIMAVKK